MPPHRKKHELPRLERIRLHLDTQGHIRADDAAWLLEKAEALERAVCRHQRAQSTGDARWCPVCGGIGLAGKWTLPHGQTCKEG
jgi:hypothetical protein